MLLSLPIFKDSIPIPAAAAIILITVIAVAAGITNPRQRWVMVLDVAIALAGFLTFEYLAITTSRDGAGYFFWNNQILAVIFFSAFYLSVKTLRGSFLPQEKNGNPPETPSIPPYAQS
jgi:ABC-type transport system involved in cytochrome c biogenesis permease subunit